MVSKWKLVNENKHHCSCYTYFARLCLFCCSRTKPSKIFPVLCGSRVLYRPGQAVSLLATSQSYDQCSPVSWSVSVLSLVVSRGVRQWSILLDIIDDRGHGPEVEKLTYLEWWWCCCTSWTATRCSTWWTTRTTARSTRQTLSARPSSSPTIGIIILG